MRIPSQNEDKGQACEGDDYLMQPIGQGVKGILTAQLSQQAQGKQHREDLTEKQKLYITVTHRELLGNEVILYFDLCGKDCCMKASVENEAKAGDTIPVWVDVTKLCLFDRDNGKNLFYEKRKLEGNEN